MCPRCGTVYLMTGNGILETYVPALVEGCREFSSEIERVYAVDQLDDFTAASLRRKLHEYGISEAINKPEGRPQ